MTELMGGQADVAASWGAHPRVLVAAVIPQRRELAERAVRRVIASGGTVLVVTSDGRTDEPPGPSGTPHLDLLQDLYKVGLHRVLVCSPTRPLRRLLGRGTSHSSWMWWTWTHSRGFTATRPWLLWRALRRRLADVDVQRVDHVVALSAEAWPLAWHLSRRNPRITVSNDVPDSLFERLGLELPAPLDEED